MEHAAERGWVWIRRWRRAASGVPMLYSRWCAFFACSAQKRIYEHQTKAVFDLKLLVGWGEHKVVLDESGFRAYRMGVAFGLNFLSVRSRAERSSCRNG